MDEFPQRGEGSRKDAGVFRNGNKVTVKITSQAPAFSLREFKVKKGDEVTLILTNHDKVEDLTHGFAIPKYNINFIVNPQETASVTFKADKPGVFWCYCTHFCHALHLEMRSPHDRRSADRPARSAAHVGNGAIRTAMFRAIKTTLARPPVCTSCRCCEVCWCA